MVSNSQIAQAVADYRRHWKRLALTAAAYKLLAYILLAPLVGVLFRVFLAFSAESVLADQDILFFFTRPLGWLTFVVVGAAWLGILAAEQAALLGILAGSAGGQRLGVLSSLRFAAGQLRPVLLVAGRLLAFTLLAVAPFLGALAAAYFGLLGRYDINFYLQQRPPAFWWAVGLGAVIAAGLVTLLLRLASSWVFALPLVLFAGVAPAGALRASGRQAAGHRRRILLWLVVWGVLNSLLSALVTGAVVLLGRWMVHASANAFGWLIVAVSTTVVLWAGVNLAVSLLGTSTLAVVLFQLYRRFGGGSERTPQQRDEPGQAGWLRRRKVLLAAALLGVVAATVINVAALATINISDDVQIMAHRAASGVAPGNTLSSVRAAIQQGVQWIEIDVQETADGEVVVFHDSDFMKLAGVDLKIWDATRDDLQAIDIGSRFAPEFRGERVPTLAAVLRECRGKIKVNIELKYYGHDQQLEQRVAEIVKQQRMTDDVVIMALSVPAVEKMKALRPSWKIGLLLSVSAGGLERLDIDFLAVNARFATRQFVRSAHRAGREVFAWTVNDPISMSTLIGRGVDSLITDKPTLARQVLQRRAQLSVPQRLMLELADLLGAKQELGEQ